MPSAYYFSPYQQLVALGGGRFGLSGDGRLVNAARLSIYGDWTVPGNSWTSIIPLGAKGQGKAYCLCEVTGDDALHAAIDADGTIRRWPVGPADLNTAFGALPPVTQTAVINGLDAVRLPTDWITPTTLVREIVGFVIKIMFGVQQLGADFPEADLGLKLNSLSAAQRNALEAFLTAKGVPTTGLTNNATVREAVARLAQVNWGPIEFGTETF